MSKPPGKKADYVGDRHVGDEAICIDGVSYRYPEGTVALEDIHLHLTIGSTLAIVGPNGAGKTTLLKIVLGLLEDYTGSVRVLGMSPTEARRHGRVIGWVPQRQQIDWTFPVSVRQVVCMGLVGKTGMLRPFSSEDRDYADHVMRILRIDSLADRPIGALSGGQQQRAIIARALVAKPPILMLDEPTVGVDQPGQAILRQVLNDIKIVFDVTLVVVSHDLQTVMSSCQRIACLNRRLHFHDTPGRLSDEVLSRVFECSIEGLYTAAGHPDHGKTHHTEPAPPPIDPPSS